MTPASIIPVFGSQRPYADLNFAGGSFGVGGQIVSDITRLPGFTFTRASTAMFYGSNGLLQTAASGVARFAYDPVTLASQGILVEEARTNIALQSQTFDNASWSKARATITANAATSPDGTTNADAFNEDATAASGHELVQAFTKAASAVTYTSSVFVKKGGRDWICVTNWDNSANGNRFWFNVNTGVIGSTSTFGTPFTSTSYSIQQAPNGFWRCITTFTTNTATAMALTYYSCAADGSTTPATGLNAVGLYLYQAQLEAGTGASSPIPTTTASVTRAADDAAVTGLALSYPMTVAVEAYRGLDKATDEFWVQVDDGTSTNRVVIEVNPSDKLEVAMTTGGAGQGSSTSAASVAVGATSKAAARLATNSIASALNGTLSPEDTTATTPSGPANLRIGSNQSGQAQPMYPISRIRVYKRALSDAELQAITL